jgi:density-regulated protein DRP1
MADVESAPDHVLLPLRAVVYCGACGMPPEYCEYGPDFETHCLPWLKQHHPDLCEELAAKRGSGARTSSSLAPKKVIPDQPWTLAERLTAFYEKWAADQIEKIPSLVEKYAGKEDKLFQALVKKYGDEPEDPYYADSDDELEEEGEEIEGGDGKKNKRRGAAAKKATQGAAIRVVISKVAQKKKRSLTIVSGMETVPNIKLKDVAKAFSKRFAGSSSVKENARKEKEIILQGDHMYDVAEMVVDTFEVPVSAVFLDMDGELVPLR